MPVDFLFLSPSPLWPADKGFRVHGAQMALALDRLGYRVAVACQSCGEAERRAAPPALAALLTPWPEPTAGQRAEARGAWGGPLGAVRRRVVAYRGVDAEAFPGVLELADRHEPRAVVALDRMGPAMLQCLRRRVGFARLWYAADEGAYFHLSCMVREPLGRWPGRLRDAAVLALQERAFGGDPHGGVIGVHPRDTRLLGLATATPRRRRDTIRNGVDLDFFRADPGGGADPETLVFWGSLDFPPNVDAATWLARRLMPALLRRRPDARLRLIGRGAGEAVRSLAGLPGVDLIGEVDDLRPWARSSATVAMPMRCGGGIKNKLLEAAAMGRPIVASSKAMHGLSWDAGAPPVEIADGVASNVAAIEALWDDPSRAAAVGRSARRWVESRHTWAAAASQVAELARCCGGAVASPACEAAPRADRRAAA